MSVELSKYTPATGDYVFVTRVYAGTTAGRVTGLRHGGKVAVRLNSGRYETVLVSQVSEHPQNRWGKSSEPHAPQSGYTPCACRDCMDTAVSSDMTKPELCTECTDAGCEAYPTALASVDYVITPAACFECQRDDAYDDSVGDAGTGHGAYEYHSGN